MHDAGGGSGFEGGQQHLRQEKMGQVIGDPHGIKPVAGGNVFVDEDASIVDLG
jgi:hypothetical protein